ncbi:hypothetical protein LOTGIDRAFT_169847 [Lottia gigantea]|uniref:Uncharacterized protein n=1 Tax=Lottia gigantea TaxID=225164 RepID=V3ZNT4_LOTGI|nr:hypothetical protein LOTGIDRAFT_169847 [Lottia gigantea]ESO82526.1 hypothetical protein LOTGIDRAFT_169847 [Lottia gigantea]
MFSRNTEDLIIKVSSFKKKTHRSKSFDYPSRLLELEKDLDVFSSKQNRSNNGNKSSSKPSKSAGRTARRESAITVPTFLEPPTARQRRGSLQLPFFSKNDGNSGVKFPDDTFGSLRGNKRSNLSIDDTFYASSISPGGTLGFSEGKKIKSQNKLSNLFSPQIKFPIFLVLCQQQSAL